MESNKFTRRRFLQSAGVAASLALTAACAPAAPAPTATQAPEATAAPTTAPPEAVPTPAGRYGEAPGLAEMVQAGTLPPVEERLPREPMVIPVTEEIGQYGGIWHRCAVGPGDAGIINSRLSYENLVRWNENGSDVVPNVARAFEINDDATEFTFYLREGMRWSDGEPFTADDFVFWYEDVLLNEEMTPTIPRWLRDPSGEPVVLEKVDDYTIRFVCQNPYGLLIQILAGPPATSITDYPRHYLEQFHPKYADADELARAVKDANFENWTQLFGQKRNWQNPEQPHIWAWQPTRVPPDIPIVCERNPYYWKVDPEGNQLPYIDRVQFDIVENADLLNLKAVAGEIDMQFRHLLWTNYPLFVENAESGDYRVMRWTLAEGSNVLLLLNHNHQDPGLRELIENRDFRIALSLGINRSEINELAYQGFGTPRQASLIPLNPYFKEEHATFYAEFDPDQANQVLDDLGLTAKDADGFRLRPDGTNLTFVIEYSPVFGPWGDTVQMICDTWATIGIRGIPKEEDRTLFDQRGAANERDIGIWTMDRCLTPLIEPLWWGPLLSSNYNWAIQYAAWYNSGGVEGEEPPDDIRRQMDLYDQIKGALPEDLPALAQDFFDHFSDRLWVIGTVGVLPHVGVVKNNFRNVPEQAVSDWLQLTPGNTNVEQYFIRQG
ncbi:MAG: ABC transporter substrate-binding protein [Anaerolineae bacterium]|nr:ABC transporter substrate-binding protein [Anaerolineae bacterium]